MPIEQNATVNPSAAVPVPVSVSAIENEIPTYRAISPEAVLSLILGVLAIFSFAHWVFLIAALAAIVVGVLADRKIVRLSDVLTGRGIAQAGIALGLSFALAAVTITAVQGWIRVREAGKFANVYANILKNGAVEDAIWYGQSPPVRKGKTPQELVSEMKKPGPGASMFDVQNAALLKLKSRITDGADLHFSKIESTGNDGLSIYAAALFELHPAASKPLPEDERYAVVVMKGMTENRRYEWWVDQVGYPYKPASYKAATKPADDGHGHAH